MKKSIVFVFCLIIAATFAVALTSSATADAYPDVIPLPNGFRPEGIEIGYGHTAYAGSLADGDIYVVDLQSGDRQKLVEGPGTPAVGLSFDDRSGYLFVAGGPAGTARVYDSATGALVTAYDFSGAFVNDAIVAQDAVYFTDSFVPVMYKVELGPSGVPATSFASLPLGGDFVPGPGFNSNGIVALPDGSGLIIVHSARGELYLVDPQTGVATLIDLGGANANSGDGMLLVGQTLYVVQNFFNQIAEFQLSDEYSVATLTDIIIDDDFDIPTTADNHGNWLYAVNARFTTPPGSETTYDIVKVER